MADTVQWLTYDFMVYAPSATKWNDVSGVYIFTGLDAQNRWVPLYVGKADSFRNRIPQHEKWTQAVQAGATHIHALGVPQESQREAIEQELIQQFQPRLNVQLR